MDLFKLAIEQSKLMKQNIISEEYKWKDEYLFNELTGIVMNEQKTYRNYGSIQTDKEKQEEDIVLNINKNILLYNKRKISREKFLSEINKLYSEYNKYKSDYYTNYHTIISQAIFNKVYLITGPGGIGKSQYMFDFYLKNKDKCIILYGKQFSEYTDYFFNSVIDLANSKEIIIGFDAINEIDNKSINKVINFINQNKSNKNIRFILTYRDYSLTEEEINLVDSIVDKREYFTGVEEEDVLLKITEKYNIDLSIYGKLLYENNPLHLKMILSAIINNDIYDSDNNSIAKGTFVYEKFIKRTIDLPTWKLTKKVVLLMFELQENYLDIEVIKSSLGNETKGYIDKMKINGFIDIYKRDDREVLYFKNETLVNYLITRSIFENLNINNINEVIDYIKAILKKYYYLNEQIILLIFDKYDDIRDSINIIIKTDLINSMSLELLNELCLTRNKIKIIVKSLKPNHSIKELFLKCAGFENNPFNCKNYLNELLIKDNKFYCDLFFDEYEHKNLNNKIKIWTQTVSKFNYSNVYLEEKLYFSIWLCSSANKKTMFLARKLAFEICQKNTIYVKKIIKIYGNVDDDYIKESIIHILSSLKKGDFFINKFFKRINNKELLNINILSCIKNYKDSNIRIIEYENKTDLIKYADKKIDYKIKKFISRVSINNKYDYSLFGYDIYNTKGIYLKEKFICNEKKKIKKINELIKTNVQCNNEYYCNCNIREFIKDTFKIYEKLIPDKLIYLSWQSEFKRNLKKYSLNKNKLDSYDIYKDGSFILKILDISINNIKGSIGSNYYLKECNIYDDNFGYESYQLDNENNIFGLTYPISVFNEKIDGINYKIYKLIKYDCEKNEEWAKNSDLSEINLKKLFQPIKFNSDYWNIIYVSIKNKYNDENELIWSDDYIINLAINEPYNLTHIDNKDRKYTIETNSFDINIDDVSELKNTQTISLKKNNIYDGVFLDTDFNCPPYIIIKEFDLKYNKASSAWVTSSGEEVILINNNKGSWYKDVITGTVLIKNTYFKILIEKYNLKYFCFTERFLNPFGYNNDSALQYEYNLNTECIYKYKHYIEFKHDDENYEKSCEKCIVKYFDNQKNKNKKVKKVFELIDYNLQS